MAVGPCLFARPPHLDCRTQCKFTQQAESPRPIHEPASSSSDGAGDGRQPQTGPRHRHRSCASGLARRHPLSSLGAEAAAWCQRSRTRVATQRRFRPISVAPNSSPPLIRACSERLGPVTCLINNAAHYDWDNLESMSLESWTSHLDIDLRAPVFLTQAFAAFLPQAETGNVINLVDQKVWRLNPDFFSYTIAKAALWTATQTMAQALARAFASMPSAPGRASESQAKSGRVRGRMSRHTTRARRHARRDLSRGSLPARHALDHGPDDRARWCQHLVEA